MKEHKIPPKTLQECRDIYEQRLCALSASRSRYIEKCTLLSDEVRELRKQVAASQFKSSLQPTIEEEHEKSILKMWNDYFEGTPFDERQKVVDEVNTVFKKFSLYDESQRSVATTGTTYHPISESKRIKELEEALDGMVQLHEKISIIPYDSETVSIAKKLLHGKAKAY